MVCEAPVRDRFRSGQDPEAVEDESEHVRRSVLRAGGYPPESLGELEEVARLRIEADGSVALACLEQLGDHRRIALGGQVIVRGGAQRIAQTVYRMNSTRSTVHRRSASSGGSPASNSGTVSTRPLHLVRIDGECQRLTGRKFRYSVPAPTPARCSIWLIASSPFSAGAIRATDRMRAWFSWASMRVIQPSLPSGELPLVGERFPPLPHGLPGRPVATPGYQAARGSSNERVVYATFLQRPSPCLCGAGLNFAALTLDRPLTRRLMLWCTPRRRPLASARDPAVRSTTDGVVMP